MGEGSPIERLRRAGLHDALLDLLGIDEGVALREIEPFLARVEIPRGERLCRQGDADDDLHILVSGRLRAVTEDPHGRLTAVGEICRGQTVGEFERELRYAEMPSPWRARARESVGLYLTRPLQRSGLLRWEVFDKVVDIGYRYAVEAPGPEVVARLCGRST